MIKARISYYMAITPYKLIWFMWRVPSKRLRAWLIAIYDKLYEDVS